jgi:hypothetical protein
MQTSRHDAALWASAFVTAALILLQAGRLGPMQPAYAATEAEAGTVRLLTADAGGGEEILAILNSPKETISVYSVQNQRTIELYQVADLGELFAQARGEGPGGQRR